MPVPSRQIHLVFSSEGHKLGDHRRPGLSGGFEYGEVAERLKAHAWKVCIGNPYPGFESLPLRHFCEQAIPAAE